MGQPRKSQRAPSEEPLKRPLTKSRFKIAQECPTKLYYTDKPQEYGNDKQEDPFLRNLARGGFQVGALAKVYFSPGTEIAGKGYEDPEKETRTLLEKPSVTLFEAAFRFENLFVRADIVKKDGDTLYVYEVKAGSYDPEKDEFWQKRKTDHLSNEWKEYLYDIAFQHYVIKNAFPGYKVVPHLYLANKRAVSTVEGLNQKFRLVSENGRDRAVYDPKLTAEDLGERLLIEIDVSREVNAIQMGQPNGEDSSDWPKGYTFSTWVSYLADQYLNDTQIAPKVTGQCKNCEFRIETKKYPDKKSGFEQCWTQALTLKPGTFNNRTPIFEIWRLTAAKLLDKGITFIDQLSEEDLVPKTKSKEDGPLVGLSSSERKVLQWRSKLEEKNEPYFDKDNFRNEIAGYTYPLHFIDFETTTTAIPFNKGRRPYEQIAFQFSHHTLQKDGAIAHASEWINTERGVFPNFKFVRALKESLSKDDGTIFRYAAHENTVLCQIRTQLLNATDKEAPDKEELIKWIETITNPSKHETDPWEPNRSMVDMLELVVRYFWHPRMGGSNSIKVVLPAMMECSEFLKTKYSEPIYGAQGGIKSLNYKDYTWIRIQNGIPDDPYHFLPSVFEGWDRESLDRLYGEEELADGGAAMMAYAKMQFTEMSNEEREKVTQALLRYCELDTLAMVMLWEGWKNFSSSSG